MPLPHFISILRTTLLIIIFLLWSDLFQTASLLFKSNTVLCTQQRRQCSADHCQEIDVKKERKKYYLRGRDLQSILQLLIPPPAPNFIRHKKKNPHKKKSWTQKYQREEILDARNTRNKKLWSHKIPTSIHFGLTK